jgi:RNA polymerase sigma-70 factor (ECF subfamily)
VIGEDFATVLAAAQEGDEAAFERLWRDLNPAVVRYLTLGGEPAEDVAAETWSTIVKGLRRFTGDERSWRTWVFVTARRRAVDAARRRARAAAAEQAWRQWSPEPVDSDVADLLVERWDTQAALRLVARLSPLQAEVVLLRVVSGLGVDDVARIVGRSPAAVRVASHRGLRRLEQLVAPGVTPRDPAALRD